MVEILSRLGPMLTNYIYFAVILCVSLLVLRCNRLLVIYENIRIIVDERRTERKITLKFIDEITYLNLIEAFELGTILPK